MIVDAIAPCPGSIDSAYPRRGHVATRSWAGYVEVPVIVLSETAKRYRVKFLRRALRWAEGSVTLVPKYSVGFRESYDD